MHSLLTMWMLSGLLFLSLYLSCGEAFMFSSPREEAKEPLEEVPCGAHSRVRPNLPVRTRGWLVNKWLWLFFVILYVILKFQEHSLKAKGQNSPDLRGFPFRSPFRKNQHGCPSIDYAYNSLIHLEKDLMQFLSKVRHLKAALISGINARLFPVDPQSCVTIYEVWGEYPE